MRVSSLQSPEKTFLKFLESGFSKFATIQSQECLKGQALNMGDKMCLGAAFQFITRGAVQGLGQGCVQSGHTKLGKSFLYGPGRKNFFWKYQYMLHFQKRWDSIYECFCLCCRLSVDCCCIFLRKLLSFCLSVVYTCNRTMCYFNVSISIFSLSASEV